MIGISLHSVVRARAPRAGSLLLVVGLSAACVPSANPVNPVDVPFAAAAVTRDGDEVYTLSNAEGTVTVTGPATQGGGNTRVVFWHTKVAPSLDHQSCATWTSQSNGRNQQGAALRIQVTETGTRAITITKNVFASVNWTFNVHLWDTVATPGVRPTLLQVELADTFVRDGALVPLPWRMCARVIGSRVEFVVWPLPGNQPAWNDPAHGGGVELPADWQNVGYPGWYAGHLGQGEHLTFEELTPSP
jgi:hypothetical protein